MLKIENVDVYGWDAAIRGMRNAMNSWDKSDSYEGCFEDNCESCVDWRDCHGINAETKLGNNDLALMKKLTKAGADHGKFLRYLIVQVDITAPFYWWKEFKTYRKGRKFMDDGDEILDPDDFELFIETNSCSTMHKIHAKEFELDDFSHEHLIPEAVDLLKDVILALNDCRDAYVNFDAYKDKEHFMEGISKKTVWWNMIQLLPSSYNQRRTVQLNYQVLKAMYHARRNHKLDEWHTFCDWVETLPYFREICIQE